MDMMKKYLIPEVLILLLLLILFSGCTASIKPTVQTETAINPPSENKITVQGEFLQDTPTGMIIRLAGEGEEIELILDQSSVNWDGIDWVAKMPVVEDDHIIAHGNWKSTGIFEVERLYVNILNLRGIARNVDKEKGTFLIQDKQQGNFEIKMDPETKVFLQDSLSSELYKNAQNLPEANAYVEVIGRKIGEKVIAVNVLILN
jgi:hypothetical protein